jgi:hypothetical protein
VHSGNINALIEPVFDHAETIEHCNARRVSGAPA